MNSLSFLAPVALSCAMSLATAQPAKPRAATKIQSAQTAFDETLETLPAGFAGHSLLEITKALKPPARKGEFETTEQYASRLNAWRAAPYLGSLTPESRLAIVISSTMAPRSLESEYDADGEAYTVTMKFETEYLPNVEGKARWLSTFFHAQNLGTRPAMTRMGVPFRVTSYKANYTGLVVDPLLADITAKLSIPRDEAPRLKGRIRALAIGALEEPYDLFSTTRTTASLSEPKEVASIYFGLFLALEQVWFYDESTGRVLLKLKGPFPRCKYDVC